MLRRTFLQASGAAAALADGAPAIHKAMDSIRAAIPAAEASPDRPLYHFRPPAQWSNDPNGPIFHDGWHHLFYQHNPYGAHWGHMHWGHARSRDLVNWEHLPVALWPSTEAGEEHVFSGGAIAGPDGQPLLFYTSIGKRDPEQWVAEPVDGELIQWRKHPANPVLTERLHGGVKVWDWRDPFLFRHNGKTYLVAGGNLSKEGGHGTVQLYEAKDASLLVWTYRGVLFRHPDRAVRNIECPNFFPLGGRWVLLVSPHRPVEYFVGDFEEPRGRFFAETHGVLDPGPAYASNVHFTPGGQCILWLWGRTEVKPGSAWNSIMLLPRVLTLGDDGHARQRPIEALSQLRVEEAEGKPQPLTESGVPLPLRSELLEIDAQIQCGKARQIVLALPGTEVIFDPSSGRLAAGRFGTYLGRSSNLRLRVFLDRRALEVFGNEGEAAIYCWMPEARGEPAPRLLARGGEAKLLSLSVWRLKPAEFKLVF